MEFFAIANKQTTADILQARLDIASLASWCTSISQVLSHDGDSGEIYCVWGQFIVCREPIRGGVRFTLPKCPNALAWTVTTGFPPAPESIVIHCTINRRDHDADFIATIEQFARKGVSTEWHLLKRRLHETPVCSPDGAQRNPGTGAVADRFPRISLSLHAGYLLRFMLSRCCILDQRRLSKCHSVLTPFRTQ